MNRNIVVVVCILLTAALVAFAGLFYLAIPGNVTVGLCLMAGSVIVALLTFLFPFPTRNTKRKEKNR